MIFHFLFLLYVVFILPLFLSYNKSTANLYFSYLLLCYCSFRNPKCSLFEEVLWFAFVFAHFYPSFYFFYPSFNFFDPSFIFFLPLFYLISTPLFFLFSWQVGCIACILHISHPPDHNSNDDKSNNMHKQNIAIRDCSLANNTNNTTNRKEHSIEKEGSSMD